MLNKNLVNEAAVANQSGAMEADTISKHGRISKSQMSRTSLIFMMMLCVVVLSSAFVVSGYVSKHPQDTYQSGFDINVTSFEYWHYSSDAPKLDIKRVSAISYYDSKKEESVNLVEAPVVISSHKKVQKEENLLSVTGGFKLKLPAALPSDATVYLKDDVPDGVTVSNPEVKSYALIAISGHAASEDSYPDIGDFQMFRGENEGIYLIWVDNDVTINGKNERGSEVYNNMSLKKGWNVISRSYNESTRISTHSTTTFSGIKWRFDWLGDGG